MHVTLCFVGFAFVLHFLVAADLAGSLLDGSLGLLDEPLHVFPVHKFTPLEGAHQRVATLSVPKTAVLRVSPRVWAQFFLIFPMRNQPKMRAFWGEAGKKN